jgi:arylsulfatase A-like enzyme
VTRQTAAVTLGTLLVIVLGGLLLYATPGPRTPKQDGEVVQQEGPAAAKITKAGKNGKASRLPRSVDDSELAHAREIPADRPAAPAGAPNVVLFVASTQRRDQWTPYGGPDITTPFLNARANEGVRMDDALAVAVDPRASISAIITGSYPHRLGAVSLAAQQGDDPMPTSVTTLAERFAAAGWFTVGATGIHSINDRLGGAQGFDWYRDAQPYSFMLEQRIDGSVVVQKALERIAARTDAEAGRPLYLQIAVVDSHKPFKVPPTEFQPFESPDHAIAPYRATVRRVDTAVQRLVEGLAARGITAENTVFVVLADHGEGLEMPPHHRKQHGLVLYESSVRIPWIWWGKGVARGRSAKGLASQIDLAPTLLALAGLPVPTEGIDGMDLSAVVRGESSTSPRNQAYADTLFEGAHRASLWTSDMQCQKDFGSTLPEDEQDFESACFDRESDADFTHPVSDRRLMAALEEKHAELVGLLPKPPAP